MFEIEVLPARIREKIRVTESGCWEWVATVSPAGYGRVYWDGKARDVHRVVYALLVGEIPAGKVLDHRCHTTACAGRGRECLHRRCQNPSHLRPVTQGENALRGQSPPALNATKDACDKGHEYTGESTTLDSGTRRCLVCRRETDKRRRPRGVPRKGRTYKGPHRGRNGATPERDLRDAEILRLRAQGLSFSDIAAQLGISGSFANARFRKLTVDN